MRVFLHQPHDGEITQSLCQSFGQAEM
jgi:hypothetical protein